MGAVNPLDYVNTFTDNLTNNTVTQTMHDIMTKSYTLDFTGGAEIQTAIAIVMLIVGATLVYFGCRVFKFTLFALIFTGVAGVVYFSGMSDPTANQKVVFGVAIATGFVCGLLAIKLWRLALFAVGAFVGFVLWLTYKSLYPESAIMGDEIVAYAALAIMMTVLGVFSVWMEQYWLLVATPVLGTFMFFQGLNKFTSWGINAFATLNGDETCTSQQCFAIYAGMVTMCVSGMLVQYEVTSKFAASKPKRITKTVVHEKIVHVPTRTSRRV
jgi:hypothetical protein